MSNGPLGGMAMSQHIPTPQPHADRLPFLVRRLPGTALAIGDLTGCGAGNLLAPFAAWSQTRLFGIEISAERADAARQRLPGATIVPTAFESTRPTPDTFSLCVSNPPYTRLDDGRRAEYAAQVLVTKALCPAGVSIAILPSRSGLDGALINHWARHFAQLRCWRFPDGDPDDDTSFQKYSQIVLAGIKRAAPLAAPDPTVKAQLLGWRYDTQTGSWAGGTPPPVLPDTPIPDPYDLPAAPTIPEILVLHADDAVLLRGLATSGIQQSPTWQQAVSLHAEGMFARPLMPPTGPAHLAALILAGLLDGDILSGPQGERFVITTATSKQATQMPVDPELRAKGVVAVAQIEDNPVLGVLDLATGAVRHYHNDDAFRFLQPLLPTLAGQVLAKHQPRYQLDPEDWEIQVVAQIGLDKQLPGAEHPGLAPAQMHRVFALRRALWEHQRAMFQGEPGVGKTRQIIALIATLCQYWQQQAIAFRNTKKPAWARKLAKAWKANRHTHGSAPRALPIWIAPPKRVIPTWQREIAGAFPAAEVIVIRDHRDVDRWLQRCAESDAPAVIALISHSTKAATGLRWLPAVDERRQVVSMPDLNPPAERLPELDPIRDERRALVGYRDRVSGEIVTTSRERIRFRCPSCHTTIVAVPRGKQAHDHDGDSVEPVTSLTYFSRRQRWCADCGNPLWSVVKTEARERMYPHTPFATWSRAVDQWQPAATPQRIRPDGTLGPVCPDSFSPYAYAYRKYRGCVALAVIDESHTGRSETTDIARAQHQMMRTSQCRVLASGTHTGGELRHLYHYLYRYHPDFWRRLGLGWDEVEQAVQRYGVLQEHTVEHETEARRGSGMVDRSITVREVPGISATLLPHFLSEMVYIGVLDVGAFMPKLVEIPVLVDMADPALEERLHAIRDELHAARDALDAARDQADPLQIATAQVAHDRAEAQAEQVRDWVATRDLAGHYTRMLAYLDDLAEQGNNAARLAKGSIPRWWSVLPMVAPAFTVVQKLRGPWGDIVGEEPVLTAPLLAADHRYPLERRVCELVAAERRQQRRVMLYVEQNGERVTSRRYAGILAEYRPWCLPHMDPERREDAIRQAVRDGHSVVIVPYSHVSEGLNLQNEFDSILWIEMAQSHYLRDQASRRIWRLGKQFDPAIPPEARDVRIYYLVYRGSSGHKKLHKLGQQNGAAILFAGDTPDGALVKQAGADHTALAKMSRDIHQLDDDGALDAGFARRNDERFATLQRGRGWIGVQDTLPERLAAIRIALGQAPAEVLELAPAPEPELVPVEPTIQPEPAPPPERRRPNRKPVDVRQLTLW